MAKILIIGGTGNISTPMTAELLARGDDVTLFNRGQTESRVPPGVKTINGDRNDFAAFETQMAEAGTFDAVIDMICFTPEQAESAVRAFAGRTAQFIFCSTVNVYTKPAHSYPIYEDAERQQTNDDYGLKKAQCEDIFMAAHERGDFATTNMRPAHTYSEVGSIIHTFGWTTTFVDRIVKGKPIVVHGDGSSIWGSCHSKDVGHAFVNAIGNQQAYGKAYHVTGEEWMPWNQYYEIVAEAIGAPPLKMVHIPTDILAQIAPQRAGVTINNFSGNNIFDNAAARADLGFEYTVTWEVGAREIYEWQSAHGKILNSDDDPFDDRIIAAWEKHTGTLVNELADLEASS